MGFLFLLLLILYILTLIVCIIYVIFIDGWVMLFSLEIKYDLFDEYEDLVFAFYYFIFSIVISYI